MINCVMRDLPPKIRSFARENEDGSYTVVLNSRLSAETVTEAYQHEVDHINGDDFDGGDTDKIEKARHN